MPELLPQRLDKALQRPCPNAASLHDWIRLFTGLRVPRRPVCPNHQAPFDYLATAYFEPASDLVVWAPRGGGKTRLAAVATMLDLLHKPGSAVRILGGSLEQSLRMWEHLLPNLEQIAPHVLTKTTGTSRRMYLDNRSMAAVLTQSQRAVRGLRVQKLRCDEVELFDPRIWDAAQLVTRSMTAGGGNSRRGIAAPAGQYDASIIAGGAIEAISTFHAPHGLMNRIIEQAQASQKIILRWCLLEVLERCSEDRECATCPLWDDCRGVAKLKCDGFFRIDDAIVMKQRVSREIWDAEMLCRRPVVRQSVFPNFDIERHVRETLGGDGSDCPDAGVRGTISLAIDFGFHNPFACLWIVDDGKRAHVIDEYVQSQQTVFQNVEQIESRAWKARRICCDPAGNGRNDQTAESDVTYLRRRGYKVHCKRSRIIDGLEMIRSALCPASGEPTLFIHPRCRRLIAAMQQLRYPEGGGELPLKDGTHDHPIDALRYFYVNRSVGASATFRAY